MKEKIFIDADHAGFELKEVLVTSLTESGYTVIDVGARVLDPNDDYPAIISAAAREVSMDPEGVKAIVIGGSGTGEAIVANRFPAVRAAVYYGGNTKIVELSREHNNANVLSLGARFISKEEAITAVNLWLSTKFSEDPRHIRRIAEIESVTNVLKITQ